jgi:hypothetical protein
MDLTAHNICNFNFLILYKLIYPFTNIRYCV